MPRFSEAFIFAKKVNLTSHHEDVKYFYPVVENLS